LTADFNVSDLSFERDGAEIISGAVSALTLDRILPFFESGDRHRPGSRSLNAPDEIREIVRPDGEMGSLAQRLGPGSLTMRPVRIVLFDKSDATNWAVPWHQDRTIAVRDRCDVEGYGNWNVKDGVVHVEPPVELLARMATLRLHLDDTDDHNGPLDILPGSHRRGRLPAAEVVRLGKELPFLRCSAKRGDVLAMRLLTLHKSEKSTQISRRRVLHVDYSPDDLPAGLAWHVQ
jgi:hypothetical protein